LVGLPLHVDEKAIEKEGAELFWASVDERDGKIFTSASRSLAVVGIDDSLENAEKISESALKHIKGRIYTRHDIGKKEAIMRRVQRMNSIRKAVGTR